jgi:hypothetical protein
VSLSNASNFKRLIGVSELLSRAFPEGVQTPATRSQEMPIPLEPGVPDQHRFSGCWKPDLSASLTEALDITSGPLNLTQNI